MRRLVLLLALLPAPLAAQDPYVLAPGRVAGCYAVTLGPWTPAGAATAAHTPPRRFVLDTVAAPEAPAQNSLRVGSFPGDPAGPHRLAFWSPLPLRADSLRIVWSTGSEGVELRLQVRGDTLRGRATALVDAPGQARSTPTARAVARRITPCDLSAESPAVVTAPPGPAPREPADSVRPEIRPAAPDRSEQVVGYTLGGVLLWMLLHITGIL
ncbi:MAG TPA: hypothetical protein VHG28_22585 [Longimicrobiaceae bacterium]|nr:hypothetical protein [Longimicrobiaceae bacterium]